MLNFLLSSDLPSFLLNLLPPTLYSKATQYPLSYDTQSYCALILERCQAPHFRLEKSFYSDTFNTNLYKQNFEYDFDVARRKMIFLSV